MIRAEVHSDDFHSTAKFDATPWFEQASDDEIMALDAIGWGGDQEADDIARFVEDRPGYDQVERVLDYARENDGIGFECHIHEDDARIWLNANRPALLREIVGDTDYELDRYVPVEASTPYWDTDGSWKGDYAIDSSMPDMTDLERDAERWRKLVAIIQASYDGQNCDLDGLRLNANMLSGSGTRRWVEVGIAFADVRDEPIDLGAAIDAAPWPETTPGEDADPDQTTNTCRL